MKVKKRLRIGNVIYLPNSEIDKSLVSPDMLIYGFVKIPYEFGEEEFIKLTNQYKTRLNKDKTV